MGDTREALQDAIGLTIVYWNILQLDEHQQAAKLEEDIAKLAGSNVALADFMRWGFQTVATAKKRWYPRVNAVILDVRFYDEPDDSVYFEVMYTPTKMPR